MREEIISAGKVASIVGRFWGLRFLAMGPGATWARDQRELLPVSALREVRPDGYPQRVAEDQRNYFRSLTFSAGPVADLHVEIAEQPHEVFGPISARDRLPARVVLFKGQALTNAAPPGAAGAALVIPDYMVGGTLHFICR